MGIYADNTCTQNASFVNWGDLRPGENTTKTVWIKNLGTTDVALSVAATDWEPQNAYPSISLSWNQEGRTLVPNEVVQATLTLTVSPDVAENITTFNFNIRITGPSNREQCRSSPAKM